MLVAADHPARGRARAPATTRWRWPTAGDLLAPAVPTALSRPGVDGVLGTADIVEDLLLLGALDGKVVIGSMNRGGLAGTAFEIDDRFTGYDAAAIDRMGFQGGKMLLRIDPERPATAPTLRGLRPGGRRPRRAGADGDGGAVHLPPGRRAGPQRPHAPKRSIRSATVAAGLGGTSAYTWLKLPVIDDMEPVLAATTCPSLLLGGEVSADQDAQFAQWEKVLASPTCAAWSSAARCSTRPTATSPRAVDAVVEML